MRYSSRRSAALQGAIAGSGAVLLLWMAAVPAASAEQRSGAAVYGDWTADAPGVRHLIRPADLPAPYASTPTAAPPDIVARPKDAWPKVPPGFSVSAFVTRATGAREMRVAPNGDVFLAQSAAGRVTILHAPAGAATASGTDTYADRLDRPFGIAFYPPGPDPHYVYIASETRIVRFAYHVGDKVAAGPPETIVASLPDGGHWTRNIVFSPDGRTLYIAVGSESNDAEGGMDDEARRANILECNPDGSALRVFAAGIRNPVGLAVHPATGALWAAVNERDGLGDDLPPDYVTQIVAGGFYGWPWSYIGRHQDPRHRGEQPDPTKEITVPDVLIQPHSAPLGLAVYDGGQFPADYRGDLFVALHGSWNRAQRTGYKIVRVLLDNGKPTGGYEDFMTGLVASSNAVWGRPVGVAVAADGALLVSDDASGTVWRIAYLGAGKGGETTPPAR